MVILGVALPPLVVLAVEWGNAQVVAGMRCGLIAISWVALPPLVVPGRGGTSQ